MSLARVQKQLMRDLKRSPAKAGALLLLCVVALYFWAPLVAGWFGKTPAKAAMQPEAGAMPVTPAAVASPAVATVPWQKVIEGMESDRRMQSAQLGALNSPPFGLQRPDAADPDEAPQQPAAAAIAADMNLSELGLKLSSTMLGSRRRVAVINGRPYAEGVELEVGSDLVFLVARVTERSVLLERDGKRFELSME
jgi:hypothetical protein